MRNIRERDVLAYLKKRVSALGGELRKVRWEGRRGAPDKRVMLDPPFWVELKRPGEKPEAHQIREHIRMREHGEVVAVLDSFEAIDYYLRANGYERV